MKIYTLLVAASAFALILVIGPAPAAAGALGKVTKGISNKTGSSGGRRKGGGGASKRRSPPRDHRVSSTYDAGVSGCHDCSRRVVGSGPGPSHAKPVDVNIDLYLGMQSVEGSDGAVVGSIAFHYDGFGFAFTDNSYYENLPQRDGPDDTIRMDLWHITVIGRVARMDKTALWLQGGVSGARSNQFDSIKGPVFGAYIEHRLSPDISIQGGGRYFLLEHDVRARELRAAVRASVLMVGYRNLQFDVGPPLKGPEVGISLRF